MGFLRSAVRSAARASSGPLSGIATPEKWVVDWWTGDVANSSGVRVDQETALMYAPFFAGVRVIAEDLGALPLFLYERLKRGKARATSHPLYTLLHDAPNDMMGAMAFREALQGHALTWGGGAAYVVTHERTGVIEELWPLRPDRLHVKVRQLGRGRAERWFQYVDDVNGIYANLAPGEVLYVNGLGFDGLRGYSVVELAANSIGLGLATEHYGAKTFSNGSAPAAPCPAENLSPEARKRMADDWENIHRGIDRAHRVAILEEGVTWQQVGLPNDANQFLETRKLQVTDMARWLRLPPHKIGDLERATFSNIEQQQLDYVSSALNSWLVRWEQAILTQLLLPEERRRYFVEHLVDALLRGDTMTRYQAYAVGRQWGWMSANDVRERENMNPVDGGDAYLVPLNMVPASGPGPDDEDDDTARTAARRRARLLRGRGARERLCRRLGTEDRGGRPGDRRPRGREGRRPHRGAPRYRRPGPLHVRVRGGPVRPVRGGRADRRGHEHAVAADHDRVRRGRGRGRRCRGRARGGRGPVGVGPRLHPRPHRLPARHQLRRSAAAHRGGTQPGRRRWRRWPICC